MTAALGFSSNTFNPDKDVPDLSGKVCHMKRLMYGQLWLIIASGIRGNRWFSWYRLRHRCAYPPTQPGEDLPPVE